MRYNHYVNQQCLHAVGYDFCRHLGHTAGYSPTYRGFSSWYGLPYSSDMGCIDTTPQGCRPWYDRNKGQPSCPALCPATEVDDGEGSCTSPNSLTAIPLYDSTSFNCSGRDSCSEDIVAQPFDPFLLNTQYTTRATGILHDHVKNASNTDPVFLYMAYSHMHSPMAYDHQFEDKSPRPGYKRIFGNMLAELDHSVGKIIEALDDTGLRNNTLIFLTADNGPADLGTVSCDDIGSVGPFVGMWQRGVGGGGSTAKATVWEGGHRMIGIASWPGKISAGSVNAELLSAIDLLPTMAKIAGINLPSDRVYDGIDMSPMIFSDRKVPASPNSTAITASRALFHPRGSGGMGDTKDVPAMRLGNFKAFFGVYIMFRKYLYLKIM